MATTRSPLVVLGGLVAVAFVPLFVMWLVIADLGTLAYFFGFAVYFLVAHIALPGWVYLDANGRESGSPLGWTALAFLLPFLGFVIYYFVGQPDAPHEVEADPRA
ncbi:PLDc N-terminal domain-containing protein [Halobellus rubicundus]|uniref:PLDc N-terminal domain-containing protein n=1 Tax=Halobellus rubicundus TaxID=2996466 RepID=A0ABD5MCI6_9EURY